MIKSFRRSKRHSALLTLPRTITRVLLADDTADLGLPKKVIRALYNYSPQGPRELKFAKGDFFHVLLPDDLQDVANGWYEALNPATHAKGMVPILYFEVLERTRPHTNGLVLLGVLTLSAALNRLLGAHTLYAQVLYEFKAEREDELDIFPGENLIVCAHHDYEWFIAKPINRLGGPGLVPVSYVKIVDLMGTNPPELLAAAIERFAVPTVEQWKDQTARYQALTIPLGLILTLAAPQPPLANAQYFAPGLNRLLLLLTNTQLLDAGVDLYQLDHGRYQYVVVAKLSNGKTRFLYRYYQDFYDLQVRLLELFPAEAGRLEHAKRTIPLIPGPLINVNDAILKLRREKLDDYLHQLVALPAHISRCEEVLRLFDVLQNGFDREEDGPVRRALKPISQKSNYQQDRLSQYMNTRALNVLELLGPDPLARKVKVKFYFGDDIFVLLLPTVLQLRDLKTKLHQRLLLAADQQVLLFLKNDYDEYMAEHELAAPDPGAMREFEVDDDAKFQQILYDKCKLVILHS